MTAIATWNQALLRTSAAMLARPQVKLDASRHAGLDRDIAQVEQLVRRSVRPPSARQHRIGREEGREHDDVAEQEDPEAVAGDDALGRGPAPVALACGSHACASVSAAVAHCGSLSRRVLARSRDARPVAAIDPRDFLCRNRRPRRGRARRTRRRWQRRRRARRSTIHQMCQISAKPIMVAKKAQTKPVGELRGISMSR